MVSPRKRKTASTATPPEEPPAPDHAAEQLAALVDRVAELEAAVEALRANVAGSLGITV